MLPKAGKALIDESLDLDVPAEVAYGECREPEQFPLFLPEVLRVETMEDRRFRWVADYGGRSVVRNVEIEALVPNRQISWRAHGLPEYFGTVSFEPKGAERCRMTIEVHREGMAPLAERPAELQAWAERLGPGLARFKEFVERRRVTHEPVFAGMAPARPGRFPADVGPKAHIEEAGAPPEQEVGLPREDETPRMPPGPEEF